jgi:CyaY protein
MDEREFIALADECLARVARWLDDCDPDELDYSTADGSIAMEFADGAKFILSRNLAMKQMWLAAAANGYHYIFDETASSWRDDRDGHDLHSKLAQVIAVKLGHPVESVT